MSSGENQLEKRTAGAAKRAVALLLMAVIPASCSSAGVSDLSYKTDASSIYVYYSDRLSNNWKSEDYEYLGYFESENGISIKTVNKANKKTVCKYANCQWTIYYK